MLGLQHGPPLTTTLTLTFTDAVDQQHGPTLTPTLIVADAPDQQHGRPAHFLNELRDAPALVSFRCDVVPGLADSCHTSQCRMLFGNRFDVCIGDLDGPAEIAVGESTICFVLPGNESRS